MKGLLAAASLGALLIAAPAWAQSMGAQGNAAHSLSSQDKTFVTKAGAGNLAEARLGELAEQKGGTPAVKEFGRWMATDHTFANNWLMGIAKEIPGIPQPMLTAQDKAMYQKLEGLSGAEFDRQYLPGMVQGHVKAVGLFETEARDGSNPQIKGYAQSLLPVFRQHLAEARELSSGSAGIASNMSAHGTEGSGGSMPPQH
jgi:putative membrane protein